jgi:hypothetical protein
VGDIRTLPGHRLAVCLTAGSPRGGYASGVPVLRPSKLDPTEWPTDRRPQHQCRRDHQVAVVILRAYVNAHVPCRR